MSDREVESALRAARAGRRASLGSGIGRPRLRAAPRHGRAHQARPRRERRAASSVSSARCGASPATRSTTAPRWTSTRCHRASAARSAACRSSSRCEQRAVPRVAPAGRRRSRRQHARGRSARTRSTGPRSTAAARRSWRSWSRCSSTPTPRAAGAASCSATSATRPRGKDCGGCDNCLGTHDVEPAQRSAAAARRAHRRSASRAACARGRRPKSWCRARPTRSFSSGCARCAAASPARTRCRRTSCFADRTLDRDGGAPPAIAVCAGRDPRRGTCQDREVRRPIPRAPARRRRHRSRLTSPPTPRAAWTTHSTSPSSTSPCARWSASSRATKWRRSPRSTTRDATFPWENVQEDGRARPPRRALERGARRRRPRPAQLHDHHPRAGARGRVHGLTVSAHTTLGTSPIVNFGTDEQRAAVRAAPRQRSRARRLRPHRAGRRLRRRRHADAPRCARAIATSSTARSASSPTAASARSSSSRP